MTVPQEPKITINGIPLTDAQAMTLRVAATSYFAQMGQRGALGEDESGEKLREIYRRNTSEILTIMVMA